MKIIAAHLVLAVLTSLCLQKESLALGEQGDEALTRVEAATRVVEESIRKEFDPKLEYAKPPATGGLVEGVDLQGTWSSPVDLQYTAITFKKQPAGEYSVEFRSGGCLMDWLLHREATYSGSAIAFNKPVHEYLPATYTRMYTISFKGTVYLIASDRITKFEEDADDSDVYEMWLLKRRPNKPIERDHYRHPNSLDSPR